MGSIGVMDVADIAMSALGQISVDLFQPGGKERGDFLITRDGKKIGYGELANRFSAALYEEIADRCSSLE